MAKAASKNNDSTANIGFEAKLWLAAHKLRNNMDAAEYKHVVLGLIFIKYISDAFEEMRAKLIAGKGEYTRRICRKRQLRQCWRRRNFCRLCGLMHRCK